MDVVISQENSAEVILAAARRLAIHIGHGYQTAVADKLVRALTKNSAFEAATPKAIP